MSSPEGVPVYATHDALRPTADVPGSPYEYVTRLDHHVAIRHLETKCDCWKALAKALDRLLACYRLRKHPGYVIDLVEQARAACEVYDD